MKFYSGLEHKESRIKLKNEKLSSEMKAFEEWTIATNLALNISRLILD